jgi:hypothetical protein
MLSFIAGMCISLPLTLFPPWVMWKLGVYDSIQKEKAALRTGQYCARFLSRLIPFVRVQVEGSSPKPEPSIWVCNHSSMLDVFILLANDNRLRGKERRPIKIVYVRTYVPSSKEKKSARVKLTTIWLTIIVLCPFSVETAGRQSHHQAALSTMRFHSCANGRQW